MYADDHRAHPRCQHRGIGDVRRHGPAPGQRTAAAGDPRPEDRHDLPGPPDQPASGVQRRLADHRDDQGPRPEDLQGQGQGEGGRASRPGRDPVRQGPGRRLPAPVLGWHAPARDDRDGGGPEPGAAHRRRADHGAGRHGPGAGAQGDAQGPGGVRDRDHPDHPRPRRGRRDGRRDRGHVRRPGDGARVPARALLPPPPPLHRGPADLAAEARGSDHAADARSRDAAQPDQPAPRAARSRRGAPTSSTGAWRRPRPWNRSSGRRPTPRRASCPPTRRSASTAGSSCRPDRQQRPARVPRERPAGTGTRLRRRRRAADARRERRQALSDPDQQPGRPRRSTAQGRRRREPRDHPRGDLGPGRGDGLWQVDAGALHDPALRPDRRQGVLRRPGHQRALASPAAPGASRDPDDLPGPLRLVEPAPTRRARSSGTPSRSTASTARRATSAASRS